MYLRVNVQKTNARTMTISFEIKYEIQERYLIVYISTYTALSNRAQSSPFLDIITTRSTCVRCNKILLLSKESYLCHREVRYGISFTKHYIQKGSNYSKDTVLSTRSDKVSYTLDIVVANITILYGGLMLSHKHRKSI